jgi:redox-sensitive bicupin YhaK (pirin superfamily)
MIELRPFERLGKADHGWLKARFHFSFAGYNDRNRMNWGALRVWNNDRIAAGTGFDPHPHRDMEIITYVLKGAISHQDHLGNEGRTEAGQIQVMSAGRGVVHAEYNREPEETELFQIWIIPDEQGVPARWETMEFPREARAGKLVPLASGRKGDKGVLKLHADAALCAGTLRAGEKVEHAMAGRAAYLVPAKGTLTVIGGDGARITAKARDGVAIAGEDKVTLEAGEDSEVVLVDVAA